MGATVTLPSRSMSEAVEPAEGGDVLVLLAHRPVEDVDLDTARLVGEVARSHMRCLKA